MAAIHFRKHGGVGDPPQRADRSENSKFFNVFNGGFKQNSREFHPVPTDETQLKLVPLGIPTGFRPEAQGCEERATLGHGSPMETNPNGVVTKSYFRLQG